MKKMFVLLCLLLAVRGAAQDSTARPNGILIPKGGGWRLEGQKHRLSDRELKATIYQVPAAVPVYKQFVTRRAVSFSLLVPAGVFLALAKRDPANFKPGFAVASIVCSGSVVFFGISATKKKKRAVQIYNYSRRVR